jgi:hypothetical protein
MFSPLHFSIGIARRDQRTLRRCPYGLQETPLPSIHRYLAGPLTSRLGRTLVVGAAVPALLLAAAACGGAASASPATGSSSGSSSGSSGSSGSGSASAYFNCLREHGVTGFGGSGSTGSTPSSSTIANARKACASLRPAGGFGGPGEFSAAFSKFKSCLAAHGVTLPSPSASGGAFRSLLGELKSIPADEAAFNACKSDLPFRLGSGGGVGGFSGGNTGTAGSGGTGSGTTTT